jgi:hypothetical protein
MSAIPVSAIPASKAIPRDNDAMYQELTLAGQSVILLTHSNRLKHDPEKRIPVFPRDKRGTRLRGDHAQTRS